LPRGARQADAQRDDGCHRDPVHSPGGTAQAIGITGEGQFQFAREKDDTDDLLRTRCRRVGIDWRRGGIDRMAKEVGSRPKAFKPSMSRRRPTN
jgi:hypothetical protein